MSRLVCALLSLVVLTGCAVVDLAAHGVKSYEKSRQPAPSEQAAVAQSSASAQSYDQDETPRQPPMTETDSQGGGTIRAQALD